MNISFAVDSRDQIPTQGTKGAGTFAQICAKNAQRTATNLAPIRG